MAELFDKVPLDSDIIFIPQALDLVRVPVTPQVSIRGLVYTRICGRTSFYTVVDTRYLLAYLLIVLFEPQLAKQWNIPVQNARYP
jgi:hypothetical protein